MNIDKFPEIFIEGFYAKLKYNTSYPDLFNWFNALSKANNPNFKILINNNDVYIQNKELKEYNCHKICTSDFDIIAKSIKEIINGIFKYSMDFSKECHENETFDEDILISIEAILKIYKNNKNTVYYPLDNTNNSGQKSKSITIAVTENTSLNVVIHKKIYRDLNPYKAIKFVEKMNTNIDLKEVAYLRSQENDYIFVNGYKILELLNLTKCRKSDKVIDNFCVTANSRNLSGPTSRHADKKTNAPMNKFISKNEAEQIVNHIIDIALNK